MPFAAGSATDQIGRAFAAKMSETLGQPIVVENKPGVNGMLGADAVAKAPPDGYTILIGTNSTNAALKYLMKKLPYDQDTAFVPVGYLGSVPLMIAVNNDVPAKTLKEFVDLAKAKPGQVTLCLRQHLAAGVVGDAGQHGRHPDEPDSLQERPGGDDRPDRRPGQHVHAPTSASRCRSTRPARSAAWRSRRRSARPQCPNCPRSTRRSGLKDYELIAYFAVFAPAGTPPGRHRQAEPGHQRRSRSKDLQEKFAAIGFAIDPGTPEALAQRNKAETAKWAKAIRDAKIEPQ